MCFRDRRVSDLGVLARPCPQPRKARRVRDASHRSLQWLYGSLKTCLGGICVKRKSLSRGKSKSMFRSSAARSHKKNYIKRPLLRGGIRL